MWIYLFMSENRHRLTVLFIFNGKNITWCVNVRLIFKNLTETLVNVRICEHDKRLVSRNSSNTHIDMFVYHDYM